MPRHSRDAGGGAFTSYPLTEAWLRERIGAAPLDAAAFQRGISRCSLARCGGMCCYDGVYVNNETAVGLERVASERSDDFRRMGLELPLEVVVEEEWRGEVAGKKTAVKPWPFRSLVAGYPGHFNETACVFHLDDGRCALQVLAEEEGKHAWHYKPLPCWLHPIDISQEGITLFDEESDPHRFPDYDGYVSRTFCGRTECGAEAAEVLRGELEFLGGILGRDLVAESVRG